MGLGPERPATSSRRPPSSRRELLDESLSALLEEREPLDLRGVIWYTWRDFDRLDRRVWMVSDRRPGRRRPRQQARLARLH